MNKKDTKISATNMPPAPPDLPLPSLEVTAEHFTRWFTPLLDNEQRACTRAALNSFIKPKGLGVRLQKKLSTEYRKSGKSCWLEDFWRTRFLARPDASIVNDNYFLLFAHDDMSREKRAASLIAAVLNYKLVLDQGTVPRAVETSTPLCEQQFRNLFGTTRIPRTDCDQLNRQEQDEQRGRGRKRPPPPPPARHIVVFCQGNIFQLDLISPEGSPHALRDIEDALDKISRSCLEEQIPSRSLGYLTTLPRTDWARTRTTLRRASNKNARNMELIENALFSVHLDAESPADNEEASRALYRGDGGNRWFDKSLQFIIFKNGVAGLNVEQSGLDRATIIDFLDYVLGIDTENIDQYSGAVQQGCPALNRLTFDLTPTFQKKIAMAAARFDQHKQELVTRTLEFAAFHENLLKTVPVSSDGFVQCALQLAQWRLTHKPGAICQNISLRQYKGGRVQYMWVASAEMMDFIALMQEPEANLEKKFQAFKKAAEQHEERTQACQKGIQPEQHLGELLNIYQRHPEEFQADFFTRLTSGGLSQGDIEEALALFKSPGWTCMHDDAFCTSFISSPHILHHGFTPFDRNNVAIGCLISDHYFFAHLSAPKERQELIDHLVPGWLSALEELQDLITQHCTLPENTSPPAESESALSPGS